MSYGWSNAWTKVQEVNFSKSHANSVATGITDSVTVQPGTA